MKKLTPLTKSIALYSLSVLLAFGFFSSSFGQVSSTGSLAGTVVDPNGAVVVGATVIVKNDATNQEFKAVTGGEGVFHIPSLNSGVYTATVTTTGFKRTVVTEIKIDAGKPSSIMVALEVGTANESVTVTGGGELIQSQSANVNTTLTGRQITDIPTASRDALDLVLTMPGTATPGRPRTSTVNGLPKGALNITLDGVNVQDNLLKSSDGFFTYIRPRTDSIEEVTVSTSNPGAESSAEGAIQIKFVTKGGTNEYHGGLYWYHRNPSLNANYWFNNATLPPDPRTGEAPRTRILLNQPGGKVGGPIVVPKLFNGRDRAFFFFNYEEYRLPEATLRSRTVFTPQAEAGIFSYLTSSGQLRTVDLLALAASKGITSTVDPRVGSLLSQIRTAVAGTGLAPAGDPNYLTSTFINTGIQIRKFPTVRFDFNLTKKHHLENIYNYQQFRSKVDFLNGADPRFPGFPNFGSQDSNRFSNVIALRSTLTPALVNEARFGLTGGTVLFFPQVNIAQFENQGGFNLGIGAAGITSATANNGPSRRNAPVKQFSDTLTWARGAHNLSFGGSYTRINLFSQGLGAVVQNVGFGIASGAGNQDPAFPQFDPGTNGQGKANFPGASDAQIGQAGAIYATLTGRVTSVGGTAVRDEKTGKFAYNGAFVQRAQQEEFGLFAQDTWRLRPNLTLTGGLRYEVQMPYTNRNSNYSANTLGDLFGISGVGNIFKPGASGGAPPLFREMPIGTKAWNTDWLNFAPSIGFNYSPELKKGWLRRIFGEGGQTVLRGGFSMAFDREGINVFQSINGSNPGGFLDASKSVGLSGGNKLTAPTLLRSGGPLSGPFAPPPFPDSITFPLVPNPLTDSANAFLPNLDVGYVESWTFGIQREITKDMVFEARYVGNRGHKLWRQYDLNETNVIENGFFDEFKLAQANLLANIKAGRGLNFRYFGPGTGTSPLPILFAHFTGLPTSQASDQTKYSSAFFARSSLVGTLNPLAPSPLGFGGQLASRGNYAQFPWHTNSLAAGLPANFWVVNPDVQGSFIIDNGTQTWYDAVTLELRRRLARGLLLEANYTFAKSQVNAYVSSSTVFSQYDSLRNTGGAKSVSPFDIRQAFKSNFIYELPLGRGRAFFSKANNVVDRIIGGWGVNGSIRIQSGTPFSLGHVQLVGMSVKELQKLVQVRKNSNIDPFTGQAVKGLVFYLPEDVIVNTRKAFNVAYRAGNDPNAPNQPFYTFGDPTGRFIAPASFGNCSEDIVGRCGFDRVVLHGPMFTRFDLSLVKRTRISERMNFEFRAEFLNAFNNIDFLVGDPANDVNNIGGFGGTTFGRVTSAYRDTSTTNDPGGRLIQIVARFNF